MRRLLLSISIAGALAAAGCGGSSGGGSDADPATLVPASAPIYAEFSLEDDEDFKAVASKLTGAADPAAELVKLLESSGSGSGSDFDYERDLEPWLGDRVGLYFTSLADDDVQGAFIAATEDEDKAKDFLAKELKDTDGDDKPAQVSEMKHKDVDYSVDTANDNAYAIVDGTVVYGSEQGVKGAIDASDGDALADTDGLKTARDQVEDDGLMFAYAGIRELAASAGPGATAQLQSFIDQAGDRIAMSGDVEDGAIGFEVAQLGLENPVAAEPGKILADLPGDAWVGGSFAAFGKTIEAQLKQLEATPEGKQITQGLQQLQSATGIDVRSDVISWIGDMGFFVRGTSLNDIGGALIVEASDPQKPKRLLSELQNIAQAAGDASLRELDQDGVEGVTIRTEDVPFPIHVGVGGSKFIVAVGDEALSQAVNPSGKLVDSAEYKAAAEKLGDDVKPAFFANLATAKTLIEGTGVLQQAGDDAAAIQRVLDNLTTVVGGSSAEGGVQRTKFVIGVK